MPDFFGLECFRGGRSLEQQVTYLHKQLTALVESGRDNGAYLRTELMAFEQAMCGIVTHARHLEERVMELESLRPRALAWMRSKYRSGI